MKKFLTNSIAFVLITLLLLVLIEGMATWTKIFSLTANPSDQTLHTTYDANLGWKNIPSIHLPNIYGTGKYVTINSQGFRNKSTFTEKKPSGTTRIICSGDSFAFGQGVSNEKTWCNLLAESASTETVNMGLPGYGVDQAYLWYMRDGLKLEHDLHIFTFIGADLERMTANTYHDFGKPILRLENNELHVDNVPVPDFSMTLIRTAKRTGEELKSVSLAKRLLPKPAKQKNELQLKLDKFSPVIAKVFQNIVQTNNAKGSIPIFVYLPTTGDIIRESRWRETAIKLANQLGLNFYDLTDEMRALPSSQANKFFIPHYKLAKGHYTEAGNRWVADQINRYIKTL